MKKKLPRISERLADNYSHLQGRYLGALQRRILHPQGPKTSSSPWASMDMTLPNAGPAPASAPQPQFGMPTFTASPSMSAMPRGQVIPRKEADPNYKAQPSEPAQSTRPAPVSKPNIPANYRTFRRVEEGTFTDQVKSQPEKPVQVEPPASPTIQPASEPEHFRQRAEPGESQPPKISRIAPPSTVQREIAGPEPAPSPRLAPEKETPALPQQPAEPAPVKPEQQLFSSEVQRPESPSQEHQPAAKPALSRPVEVRPPVRPASIPTSRPSEVPTSHPAAVPASRPVKGLVQRELQPEEPPSGPAPELPSEQISTPPVNEKPLIPPAERPQRLMAKPAAPRPAPEKPRRPLQKLEARPATAKTVQREVEVTQPSVPARPSEPSVQPQEAAGLPETPLQPPVAARAPEIQPPVETALPEKKGLPVSAPEEKVAEKSLKAVPAPRPVPQHMPARPARPVSSTVQREMTGLGPVFPPVQSPPAERSAALPLPSPVKKKTHQAAPMRLLQETQRFAAVPQSAFHWSHITPRRLVIPPLPSPVVKRKSVFDIVQRQIEPSESQSAQGDALPEEKRRFNSDPPPAGESILRRVRKRYTSAPTPPVVPPTPVPLPLTTGEAPKEARLEAPPADPPSEKPEREQPVHFEKMPMPVVPASSPSAPPGNSEAVSSSGTADQPPEEQSPVQTVSAGENPPTGAEQKPDLDQIARQVYPILMRRLSIEKERRSGRL